MRKTMWRVDPWSKAPEPVTVVKETECFLTIEYSSRGEVFTLRVSKANFYETFDAAHAAMREEAERSLENAKRSVLTAEARLAAVLAITKPEGVA